jgi:hypothetical protein
LMHLEQGDKSIQDYYGELQRGLMWCGVVEDPRILFAIFIRV